SNRWHPALQRYVEQLSGRVDGFGGNAGVVQPLLPGQPWGGPGEPGGPPGHGHPHPHPHPGGHGHGHDDDDHDHHEHTGKIEALIYDAFGDFSGFVLEGEDGDRHHYRSHEQDIEEIVREAWEMRTLLSVYTEEDDHDHPVALVLRRWHGPR
ncbi:MAG TPA: hypothetical protein VGS21_09475, partial [Acidimicrobiales bacterium]|nr:hypothetical protein [Acidimicrobiales bacterium]